MQEISGKTKNIQELLAGASYGIDYYQREYKWHTKQVAELLEDLSTRFLDDYSENDTTKDVANYGHYFLGSIVVSQADDKRHIVDGQQRLTTLTLLLIYLHNEQRDNAKKVSIESLIYDDDFGEKTFKLSVPERNACIEALFNQQNFDPHKSSESVQNLYARYNDIEELFPDDLKDVVLPLFIYWLIRKVQLVEITAYADEDAYTIFETMNDRGLSLSPTDMLKGFLLANIDNAEKRQEANNLIKKWLLTFSDYDKDTESDFFKAWFRSQYAQKIRERKKDAHPQDFDLIGTEYHRWVRNNIKQIGLDDGEQFFQWIIRDFDFYANAYKIALEASRKRMPGLESIRYNADHGFTQQLQLLLAPLVPEDDKETVKQKMGIVADFLDCWLNLRLWNFKSNAYSSMQYAVFVVIKDIRGLGIAELRETLTKRLLDEKKNLSFEEPTRLNQFSAKTLHRQLARFIDWLEQQSGLPGKYEDYIVRRGKNAYEIEHIWANHYERHTDEFPQQKEFDEWRNMIGDLLLLPKKVNASLNDADYDHKIKHYIKENILAQSLHDLSYQNNPGFRQTIEKYQLPFKVHANFKKADVEQRNALYCALAEKIWSSGRIAGENN